MKFISLWKIFVLWTILNFWLQNQHTAKTTKIWQLLVWLSQTALTVSRIILYLTVEFLILTYWLPYNLNWFWKRATKNYITITKNLIILNFVVTSVVPLLINLRCITLRNQCLKILTGKKHNQIKLQRLHQHRSGVFIVNFEHISHLLLVFLLLTLNM